MPTVLNKSERLINTHDGTPIPPGVPTEISDEAMANETIAQAVTDGILENTGAPTGEGTARRAEDTGRNEPARNEPGRTDPPKPTQQPADKR